MKVDLPWDLGQKYWAIFEWRDDKREMCDKCNTSFKKYTKHASVQECELDSIACTFAVNRENNYWFTVAFEHPEKGSGYSTQVPMIWATKEEAEKHFIGEYDQASPYVTENRMKEHGH